MNLALFQRLILRPVLRDRMRSGLTVLTVGLGVAVVLAIELAGEAAAGSFRSSVETLVGDADLEVTAPGGISPDVYRTLATLPHALRLKARIEDYAVIGDTSEVVPFLGVDMIADALEGVASSASGTSVQDAIWVSEGFPLKAGDRLRAQIQDKSEEYVVGGVFAQRGRVLVADLAFADRLLRRNGRLDRILIGVPPQPPVDEWRTTLQAALPAGVSVNFQGARTRENQRMLDAFRWNLRVLSYIALVVGAFLIYSTISISVVRRRAEIGILRAVGATRALILTAFLAEAAVFGLIGGALGILMGRVMAEGAVRLVGATVESLYVSSRPSEIALHPAIVAAGLITGITVAIIAALLPAVEAAEIAPTEAMARGRREYLTLAHRWRSLAVAGILWILAALACQLPPVGGKPVGGYAGALLLIGAAAAGIPALLSAANRLLTPVLRAVGAEPLLAMRTLAGAMRRTSVLVAALATAVAMMVSVGIMVGSFRQTVLLWMDSRLTADLYLRPAGPASADRFPTMSAEIPERLARLPEVRAIDRFRAYPISYNGLPATLAGGESQVIREVGRAEFLSGDRDAILEKLPACDCAIVSEPFANKHGVAVGSRLLLPLGEQQRQVEVLGIYYDYANERGYIVLDRAVLLKYLPDPAPSNVAIWLKPGVDLEAAKRKVEQAAAGAKILVFDNRTLRTDAIRVFDRTFAITYALEAVAAIVAIIGIAGALLALAIDRRRELGMLRFLGAAKKQIRRMIFFEAGLLGLFATGVGFAVGVVLSLILVFVINKQSFGWTIQFHWPVQVLIGALALVFAATLVAALYPARLAASLNPIEVVHEE